MSTVASRRSGVRGLTLSDRLLAAVPLASIYVWLSAIYMVEAWRRVTPWLFGDELEFTQLSRAIAATGHPAERGHPHSADSIYPYLMAPFWRIHNVAAAYSAIKYVDVLLMVAVVFPTYFLARLVVGRTASIFAAAGAGAIPSLAYSSYLVEEPIAYPYSALCLFLMTKAFVTRRRGWIVAAVIASLFAPAVRTELAVVPALFALAALFVAWSSPRVRQWRARWSTGDWLGAVVLVLGAIFFLTSIGSHHSGEIQRVTRGYKHREIVEVGWAAGALALGMGVLPFIAGLTALFRAKRERPNRDLSIFRSVATATIITFGLYTAIKAAYLSTAFATRVEERNLIYIAPILFVGTALVLSRRRVSWIGLTLAGGYGIYLVVYALYHVTQYPYQMGVQLYSDALGFAIVQQGNRDLSWTPHFVRGLMIVFGLGSVLVLVALAALRRRTALATVIAVSAAVGVIGWNLTGELAASAGTNSVARQAGTTLGHPFSWVDDATHLAPTIYIGEAEVDQNPEWLVEFWNRSIERISSLDGSVLGPGFSGSPNLLRNGALYWQNSPEGLTIQYDYGVEDLPCLDLAGNRVKTHPYRAGGRIKTWALVQLAKPNRLLSTCTGIYADGWTGADDSYYYRFSGPGGWLRVAYSRPETYPIKPSPIRIALGTLKIVDKQPALTRVTKRVSSTIGNLQSKVAWLRVPAGGFAVHVVVAQKFVPDSFDHRGDRRQLGAMVTYRFSTTRPRR
ncbi:MAG TPA: hypothetical protein VFA42_01440 [Gaiellaceae bacterium]|nr:hypothetical protein [Gaiellaceae bacterium]